MSTERHNERKRKEGMRKRRRTELATTFQPRFWNEIDDDLPIKRQIRRLYKQLKADTQAESAPKDILCQRAAFIAVQLESMEVHAAEKGVLDVGVYTQTVNAMQGVLTKLGLEKKVAKTGGLKQYLNKAG